MDKEQIELRMKLKNAQINNALGFFILFFGVIVSFSMIYSDTDIRRTTALVSGLTLFVIGGGMMLFARKKIKQAQSQIK
ncbi:MAG: hypothetical protein KAH07_01935 [Flavobacteriaceae bacterium]|nr:hypothetical protein [Flavobacteriaceae bacterium]